MHMHNAHLLQVAKEQDLLLLFKVYLSFCLW